MEGKEEDALASWFTAFAGTGSASAQAQSDPVESGGGGSFYEDSMSGLHELYL